ncbi:T9SS type A sorting domain-containing protein [Hymenobacter lutimineralis]|uniref:T9SS type A sorting domain-containing protein n=1 Tax=Hymenobacter lutimineralis TaxID=2606448 RepID=A0A5D6USJ6_9BACT|nr:MULTISPECIES: RICIN domain-containing protein [Hymenobacter]QIX60437.1 T9SS type A sorting domain-containing protein [Hymenobacter sp. BT18]TYZ06516.1 T9SS type A sorting domain-containing protein [Hymenobacter lutimineralis]
MKKSVLLGALATLSLLGASHRTLAQAQTLVDGGTYKITHFGKVDPTSKSPLCLDVDFDSKEAGASIGQWVDNGFDAQRFVLEAQTDGSYKIRHMGTTMYVQPVGLATAAGTKIEQNVSSDSDAQRWLITNTGNDLFELMLKATKDAAKPQVLEVGFASDVPGARVNLWDDTDFAEAQRWQFTLIASPTANRKTNPAELNAEVYPNPLGRHQALSVKVTTARGGAAEVELLDVLGHRVLRQPATLRAGHNTVSLSRQPLAAGIYILRVSQGNYIQQTRIVQQ